MNQEVIRRQYLEAMGITPFAAHYRLPNALATPACEWDDTPPPAPASPSQRLQALLDDAQQVDTDRTAAATPAANPASLKALLDDGSAPPTAGPQPVGQASAGSAPSATPPPRQPLNFTLSCLCLGGRWLSLHDGELTAEQRKLLVNIYRAAGIDPAFLSAWQTFTWPPMADGPAAEEPLTEAREGLSAFVNGAASRSGWALSQLLWWSGAEQAPLSEALDPRSEKNGSQAASATLSLPLWQGPALERLQDADAKRALWPAIQALGERWREGREDD